jgi:hypothetical protein
VLNRLKRIAIAALLTVMFRVTDIAGAQRSSPACAAWTVQMLPLPITPGADFTVYALPTGVTTHICGVKEVRVTGSFEVADGASGAAYPISIDAGVVTPTVCGAFAPTSGVVIPVTPIVIEVVVGNQYEFPAKDVINWQVPFHIAFTVTRV